MALKQSAIPQIRYHCFGSIRNNMALKHEKLKEELASWFWKHSKQHGSKTDGFAKLEKTMFWKHSKQHGSKTRVLSMYRLYQFWKHSKQHGSKTDIIVF